MKNFNDSQKSKGNSKSNIVGIIMMIFLFGCISYVTNLAGQMLPVLKIRFELTNAEASLGNMANFIAYAVMGIPGGFLLQKMRFKKTALIAVAIGFTGVFIQYMAGHINSFPVYLFGAFVAGFSMCLLNMVVNPMLNELGGGGKTGTRLLNIGGAFNSLTGTAVVIFVGACVGKITKDTGIADVFPVMYIALAVFGLVFIVLNILNISEPPIDRSTEPVGSLMKGALKFRHFLLGVISIFIYVGLEVGTPVTLNTYLTNGIKGVVSDATMAGSVVGTYWFLMLIGRILGGVIGASGKTLLTVASSAALILVACAIFMTNTDINVTMPVLKIVAGKVSIVWATVPINAVFLVLVGLCTSIMWGSIFNLATRGLNKYIPVASGIFMTMGCGGGILPWIQANVADVTGYMQSYWVIFAGFAFLLYYALIGSKTKLS